MLARTCGKRNVTPRYMFLIDSLETRTSRTGNHQLLSQIHIREAKKMLEQGNSRAQLTGGGMTESWSSSNRHASDLNPGFVTFVGKRERGVWRLVTKIPFMEL